MYASIPLYELVCDCGGLWLNFVLLALALSVNDHESKKIEM